MDHNFTDGIHTRTCNDGPRRTWIAQNYPDGTWRLQNSATKYCLDNSEHGVRAWGCNDLPYQRWWHPV